MSDRVKTKEQLISELAELRQRIAELEAVEEDRKNTEEALLATASQNARLYEAAQQEIVERARIEEELRNSEERLKILFESAPDAYYLSDLQGTFVDGNRAAEELVGYRKEELIGKNFLKTGLLSASQLPKAVSLLAKNALGQSTGPDEFTLNRKDGTQVPIEVSTFPAKIKDKTLVLGIARDVSRHKQEEEALKQRNLMLEVLNELSRAVSVTLEVGPILDTVAKVSAQSVDATSAYVCDWNPEQRTSAVMAEYIGPEASDRERVSDLGAVYEEGEEFAEWMGDAGAYHIDHLDDPETPALDHSHMEQFGAKSVLVVPLIAGDKPFGFIEVWESRRKREFADEEIEIIQAIAQQVSMSVENARLFEETLARTRELGMLVEMAGAFSSSLEMGYVLQVVTHQVARGLRVSWCDILLLEQETGSLLTRADHREAIWVDGEGPTHDLEAYPQTAHLLHTAEPFTISLDDEDSNPAERALLQKYAFQHMLALPLLDEDEVIGLVEVYRLPGSSSFASENITAGGGAVQDLGPLLVNLEPSLAWRETVLAGAEAVLKAAEGDACNVSLWRRDANVVQDVVEYGSSMWAEGHGEAFAAENYAIYQNAVEHQRVQVIRSTDTDLPETDRALLEEWGAKVVLAAPMVYQGKTIGLLEVARRSDRTFSDRDMELARALASQAAIAIQNARLYKAVRQARDELETEVEMRTAELREANERLQIIAAERRRLLEGERHQRQVAETLLETSSAVASTLEPGAVLLRLADRLLRVSGFHICSIFEWDREAGVHSGLAEHTRAVWPPDGGEIYRLSDYPTTEQVLTTGEPAVVHAGMDDPELVWMSEMGVTTLLMLPLRAGEETIGLAEVGITKGGADLDRTALERCQEILQGAAAWLSSPFWANPADRLLALAGQLAEESGGSLCSISVWNKAEGGVRTAVEHADMTWAPGEGPSYHLADYPGAARALEEGQSSAVRLSDAMAEPAQQEDLSKWGARTLVSQPLSVKGKPIGLIELYDVAEERVVSDDELRLWEAVADQAAVAIENARLHAETQRRLQEQIALREAGAVITSTLDLHDVLSRIAERMTQAIGATSGYICSLDRQTGTSTVLAEYIGPHACAPEQVSDLGATHEEPDDRFLEAMAAGRFWVDQLNDPALPEYDRRVMERHGAQSILYVPLDVRGQTIGYAELWESRQRRKFTPEEIALCKAMAQQASVALENARLYEQAQQEIAERTRAEEQLRAALGEKEVLLKEIHHRVKNNMQVISSLLNLQAGQLRDEQEEQVAEMFQESQDRIHSMALIHQQLYQSIDLSSIDFATYIRELTDHLLHSYGSRASCIELQINAEDVLLGINVAIPCGLIINELVSNALKHAFPDGREGVVCVEFRSDDDGRLTLVVRDNGVGLPEDFDLHQTQTLGLLLVSTLTQQLQGSIELDRTDGTTFRLTFSEAA